MEPSNTIIFLINELFKTKPKEKRENWIDAFNNEEYYTTEELLQANEETWKKFNLPDLIVTDIKEAIRPKSKQNNSLDFESSNSKTVKSLKLTRKDEDIIVELLDQ